VKILIVDLVIFSVIAGGYFVTCLCAWSLYERWTTDGTERTDNTCSCRRKTSAH
jgi:hypothetical protein